jgi:universal stress protein A
MRTTRVARPNTTSSRRRRSRLLHGPAKRNERTTKLLVPVDFSAESEKAIVYAVALARQFGAKITLFYVLEPIRTPDFAMFPLSLSRRQLLQKCKGRLHRVATDLGIDRTLVTSTVARFGTVSAQIIAEARKQQVDLILIATHGYRGLKHALLGSTAERVVQKAPCAVLVLRPHEREIIPFEVNHPKRNCYESETRQKFGRSGAGSGRQG